PGGAQPADPAPLVDVAWRLADAPGDATGTPTGGVATAELVGRTGAADVATPDDAARLPLARYVTGADLPPVHSPRPFLQPVHTAGGTSLTDVSPVDHRHHYGMSFAVPVVNGTSFWGGRTFLRD